jgi:hypothetical protein
MPMILMPTSRRRSRLRDDISISYREILTKETSILYERAYKKKIDSVNGKLDGENNRTELHEIKNDITDAYAEGKITEQHYNLLKEKIANVSLGQANNSTHHRGYKRSPI